MEVRNFADLVNLKCEERNNYSINCLMYQTCWLLCTSYGDTQNIKNMRRPKIIPNIYVT